MVSGAENVPGLKQSAEDTGLQVLRNVQAVGEHSKRTEGRPVRAPGVFGRANVGMSNHIYNEKLYPRKSKVSVAMAIIHG